MDTTRSEVVTVTIRVVTTVVSRVVSSSTLPERRTRREDAVFVEVIFCSVFFSRTGTAFRGVIDGSERSVTGSTKTASETVGEILGAAVTGATTTLAGAGGSGRNTLSQFENSAPATVPNNAIKATIIGTRYFEGSSVVGDSFGFLGIAFPRGASDAMNDASPT